MNSARRTGCGPWLSAAPCAFVCTGRAAQCDQTARICFAAIAPALAGNVNRVRRAIRFAFVLFALALAIIRVGQGRVGLHLRDVKTSGTRFASSPLIHRAACYRMMWRRTGLERVKLAAQDLITELQGDRVGLIAFAGRAFLQAPLTIDYDAAVESINDLDTKTFQKAAPTSAKRSRWRHKHLGKRDGKPRPDYFHGRRGT